MSFLATLLEPPSYGYTRNGVLYIPKLPELLREFFKKLNILADRKNWLPFFQWSTSLSFAIPFLIFLFNYFTWERFALGFVYSMVILGSHGTFWLHRYSTHRAYRFKNAFWRFLCSNLVIKVVAEELYVISHHVHHKFSEKPGDPYNVHAGWWYCFLADAVHQPIARNLSEKDYTKLVPLLNHTGMYINSYAQYLKWGSLSHPIYLSLRFFLNWMFWYAVFYAIGGHAIAITLFGMTGVWAIGVRTFNYSGHGSGKDLRKAGRDFNTEDWSINQIWPGYVAGEWHNNHHLYAHGARSGFLPYQVDLPWYFIHLLATIGAVTQYRDPKPEFLRDYYQPYLSKG